MPFDNSPAELVLDARLTPRRSLSAAGFRWLLGLVFAASGLVSLPFALIGAWPVIGFMGLDVLLLYFAFRANFRSARAYETVRVSFLTLKVEKVTATGRKRVFESHPWWTQISRETDEDFGLLKLALVSRGRSVEVASFLAPSERETFAAELSAALTLAKRGPRYS
jgi:uncharacterized membrane protein